jgi:hypothetical protein
VGVEVLVCIVEGFEVPLLLRARSCHLFPGYQPGQDEAVYRPIDRERIDIVLQLLKLIGGNAVVSLSIRSDEILVALAGLMTC